jgi:pantoate--beta-alanine ligase
MNVIETIAQMRTIVRLVRREGKVLGVVPTMGALHEGHFSLIERARRECDFVIVTIFVNPTQFAPTEDLSAYPRTPESDLAGCRQRGADAVFMPSVEEMYGSGGITTVHVGRLGDCLCGASRPGHFDGVCTVVAKLFNITQPDRAYFGAKDFQQMTILKRMVKDLDFPIEIVSCPIVREADGLAMSSRNAYLTATQRAQAPALHEALQLAAERIRRDQPPAEEVIEAMRRHLALKAPEGKVDYLRIVEPETLEDVQPTRPPVLVAMAVKLGKARLIDNTLVDGASSKD